MKRIANLISDYLIRVLYPTKTACLLKSRLLRSKGAMIGENLFIDVGVVIRCPQKLIVGNNVVMSCYSIFTSGGIIEIEDDVMIGYGCKILSQNHIIPEELNEPIRFSGHEFKKVHIKKGAWVASNVTILPGITIGEGAVIAAGSVVTKDIEPFTINAGVPAKVLRNR